MSALVTSRCIICDSRRPPRGIFTKGGRTFLKCDTCDLVRLQPLPSLDELREYYDREYKQNTGMGAALVAQEEMARVTARDRLSVVRRYTSGEHWLDIGCGSGVFLDEASKAGFSPQGIDISEEAVDKARRRNLRAYTATVENVFPDTAYDVVTAFDVIEHVLDPVSFLESVYKLLRPRGILALTSPDTSSLICRLMRRRWFFYIPEQHLFYFNRRNLSALLLLLGFNVLDALKARKALNYNYSLIQFQAYNPIIYRLWKAFRPITPPFYRQRPFSLYIGEMLIIAQRPIHEQLLSL